MSECPYSAWAFLPLEQRRTLRELLAYSTPRVLADALGLHRTMRVQPDEVLERRRAHLADRPRCPLCRIAQQEAA